MGRAASQKHQARKEIRQLIDGSSVQSFLTAAWAYYTDRNTSLNTLTLGFYRVIMLISCYKQGQKVIFNLKCVRIIVPPGD